MATIRRRNGRYQAQVRVVGSPPLSKTFATRREATTWAKAIEIEAEAVGIDKNIVSLHKIKLKDILDRYKREISPKKRGHWREVYAILALERHPISSKTLKELSERDAAQYRDSRLLVVKSSTVYRELALFRHALETARRLWGFPISTNPFAIVQKPRLNSGRVRRLEQGEWEILEAACQKSRNPCIYDMVVFGLETAMRRGEVLNIRGKHIDFENKTLLIPDTKNGHSRTIPLTEEAAKILRRRSSNIDGDGIIFNTTELAIRMAWRRVMGRAKLTDFHYHDLRREGISRFLELGLTVPEVSLISGHRCYKMLFKYVSLRPENVALKIASLSPGSLKQ